MGKKYLVGLLIGLLILILITVGIWFGKTKHHNGLVKQSKEAAVYKDGNLSYMAKINGNGIQVYKAGQWEDMLIKGVNIGMARPGTWPGEAAISESEYYRWFKYIGEMGANAIRVYTLHPPEFYKALYLYNREAKDPLYLFHGVWIDEEGLEKTLDAYSPQNTLPFDEEMQRIVDVIHGQASVKVRRGHAAGEYDYDISPYVMGWIIGIEWYPNMVENTNIKNPQDKPYSGRFFHTKESSAFENWLAQRMDHLITYEFEKYGWQRPVSFTNWPSTDLLTHPAEPLDVEDLVGIDPNHIYSNNEMKCGYFASYHVYPYYPDFMNFEEKYLNYKDHRGKENSYAAYLHELKKAHNMPVLIAEFGVPSSRGMTHENPFGRNQGRLSEKDQGRINAGLFEDIVQQNYMGGLLFSWQDEWFKRTWNTMELDNPDRRPYWSNQQTSEQHFGLLSFETHTLPLDGKKAKYLEAGISPLYQSDKKSNPLLQAVYMGQDESYIYFRIEFNEQQGLLNSDNIRTMILMDTIEGQGNQNLPGNIKIRCETGIDFAIDISSKPEENRIWVDSYYDPFYYQYGYQMKYLNEQSALSKNSGVYHPIRLALCRPMVIPSTGQKVPFSYYETGVLHKGNGSPFSDNYNSLADYIINQEENALELRIPWQLLNFKDPGQKEVLGDLWQGGLASSQKILGIRVAILAQQGEKVYTFPITQQDQINVQDMAVFAWKDWDLPEYKERLKQSYYIMKDLFHKEF